MNKNHIMMAVYMAAVGFILFTSTSCKKKSPELPSHYIPPPLEEDTGIII